MEIPEDKPLKGAFWVNIYRGIRREVCHSRDLADAIAGDDRIACVKTTWKEGDGL